MVIALTVLHVVMCFAIIAMVLFLQSGKGADIGSAFGGAGSQAVFGSMGTPTVVGKITAVVAILFTLTSFSLALLGGERASSVVREPASVTEPAAPAPPPVRWHDGKPMTADDVVFTWETTVNPKTPSPYKSDFQDVERVEAAGPHDVRVVYKRPYAKALLSWALPILPRHLLESYVKAGKIKEAPQNWTAPVGTGPYRFKE